MIEDVDGNLLIDTLTGWGSTNVGATHPEVLAAAIDALRDYGQEIPVCVSAPLVVELAEKLVQIAPDPLARVSFEISGTEAVESALKFIRARTGRPFILTFLGQYHGESYGAQSIVIASRPPSPLTAGSYPSPGGGRATDQLACGL